MDPTLSPDAVDALGVRPVDLAVMALEAAALTAEKGERPEGVVRCTPAWFASVETPRVRGAIERVLMGRHPDGAPCWRWAPSLPRGEGHGRLRRRRVAPQGRVEAHQAGGASGRAAHEVRWAALLHDIGKVKTRSHRAQRRGALLRPRRGGREHVRQADAPDAVFKGEEALAESVRFLILHHLRASQYEPSWTDSAVRRFAKEMGGCLDDLLDLSRADITTKRPERKRKGLEAISELAARVRAIQEEDARVPPLPKGLGTAISARFGVPPSPALGELMKRCRDAVEAGDLEAQQPNDYYLEWLRSVGAVG
jgi:poly(A) polymerase